MQAIQNEKIISIICIRRAIRRDKRKQKIFIIEFIYKYIENSDLTRGCTLDNIIIIREENFKEEVL